MLLVLFQLFQTRAQRVEGGGQGGDAVFSAPKLAGHIDAGVAERRKHAVAMGAAVADHGGKPLVDAALILLGALVRVELNAGKVLLDGGILLGHGAELIILRAQGSVLRAQRFGLGTQRGQLTVGCIQRGTQGVALRRGGAVRRQAVPECARLPGAEPRLV